MERVSLKLNSGIAEGISIFFIILFLYTGASKIIEYDIFREQVMEIPLLRPISLVVPWFIPLLEFCIGIMLFFPKWRKKGLMATTIIMSAFTIYVVILLTTSPTLPCSCGGIISDLSWSQHLIFNICCIGLSVWGHIMESRARQKGVTLI